MLRANKESLLTILEVFIHDPLYKWQLTTARAQQRQKASLSGQDDAGAPLLALDGLGNQCRPCCACRGPPLAGSAGRKACRGFTVADGELIRSG